FLRHFPDRARCCLAGRASFDHRRGCTGCMRYYSGEDRAGGSRKEPLSGYANLAWDQKGICTPIIIKLESGVFVRFHTALRIRDVKKGEESPCARRGVHTAKASPMEVLI
ncbi:hypothetical protein NPIL_685871, partial [Nephila pilipes]